jgi:cytochrome c peroxidase
MKPTMFYTAFANQPARLLLSSAAMLGLLAGTDPAPARADSSQTSPVPEDAPAYFGPTYSSAIQVPALAPSLLPRSALTTPKPVTTLNMLSTAATPSTLATTAVPATNATGIPSVIPKLETDLDALGSTGSYQPAGATTTATNAFFQSLGTNGRACVTCHQPSNAMGLSVDNVNARAIASQFDPLFSPVDGADCPGAVLRGDQFNSAHSLLLNKGLIRVFMPVPLQTNDVDAKGKPKPHAVEYTISVLHDPNGCNTDTTYNRVVDSSGKVRQVISIYRRPIMSGNLKFKTTTSGAKIDPVTLQPLATDATPGGFTSGQLLSGNVMWDGREPTFESQATDATLGHAQALQAPTPEQVAQIVQFETGIFNAQLTDSTKSAPLQLNVGANGGPAYLSGLIAGTPTTAPFNTYTPWQANVGSTPADQLRQSIYRGQQIFNTVQFTIDNVAGHNNAAGSNSNPVLGTCASCHSQLDAGSSRLPRSQRDIGIGGTAGGSNQVHNGTSPNSDLPIFQVTCNPGFTTPYNGTTVQTNDPGLALISGHCADVGRFTVPILRGLASRAPYFHDGSAQSLVNVVDFYKGRFNLNLGGNDRDDLVNFLAAL